MSEETKNQSQNKNTAKSAEAPKADGASAAAQNPFAAFTGAFDPMAMWTAWQNPVAAWTAAQTAFQNQMNAAQQAFQHAMGAMQSFSAQSPINPMGAWTTTQQTWQKVVGDHFVRAQAWSDEYEKNEGEMVKRAHGAVDTWAQLAHDTINYTAQLSAQARKLSTEAVRKAGFAGAGA